MTELKHQNAIRKANSVVVSYGDVIENSLQLHKNLEQHYLDQESYIRKRVALLDEIQSIIADERRCYEVQHQECRMQISSIRKNLQFLQGEQKRMTDTLKKSHATLEQEESLIDKRLDAAKKSIETEDETLYSLFNEKEKIEQEEKEIEAREVQQYKEEKELQRALQEIVNLSEEIKNRKLSLMSKNNSIAEWERNLELRELELSRCQNTLREDLKNIESDEGRLGVKRESITSLHNSIIPFVSQRQIMDDFDMTIDHEEDRVEIDKDDDEE